MEITASTKQIDEKKSVLGNYNLISDEEREIAELLRARNLAKVNAASEPVYLVDSFYTRTGKRILDIVISAFALLLTLPFNIIFAVCTYLDVGRPILYKQSRVGKDGKIFTLVKFRNMTNETDADGKLLPAKERVTKFGRFMRKYSLDELLNFWSILKGDMSIIGPRPQPVFVWERMSERHKARAGVRPGLECPRVLKSPLGPWQEGFENAVWYVENISLKTDIRLFWMLVKMVFDFSTRSQHASVAGCFVGYDEERNAVSLSAYKEKQAKYSESI